MTAAIFLAAVASIAPQVPSAAFGAGFEPIAVARSLAGHGSFANPYDAYPTGPTAHVTPLYAAFLALLVRIFGYSASFAFATSLCSLAVHGVHAALLPRVSQVFFGRRQPGIWAALLSVTLPLYFFCPQFEVIYFATALMLFCLLTHWLANCPGAARGFATGVALGLAGLLNPASITVTVPWLVYLFWRYVKLNRFRYAVFIALGAVLALTPWTWRNYREFHKLFFVRDNLGLELYVSNSDRAQGSFNRNNLSGLYQSRHPNWSVREAMDCARLGEIEYNRQRMATALAWIRQHPRRFLALSATRARMFWFPDGDTSPRYAYAVAAVTLGSFLSFFLLWRRREPVMLFLVLAQILYPLMYYLVQIDPRFRAPVLWMSLLGMGYLLASLWDAAYRAATAPSNGMRVPAGSRKPNLASSTANSAASSAS